MRNGFYIMLWLALALGGCTAAQKYGQPMTALDESEVRSANNAPSPPSKSAPQAEQTTTTQASERSDVQFVPVAHVTIPAVDPGAVWVVAKIREALDAESGGGKQSGSIEISTQLLRNQSKAQNDEFDAMVDRLARLLDAAGADEGLHFTADPAQPVDYQLKGTAYLVTANGFDLWELYLSLKPNDRAWTLWQADVPVRLLRSERLRGQQIFPPVSPQH